jgi:phosphopantothenoylcysteine decarboxylase/phosphopantothenate--cysteine ligase
MDDKGAFDIIIVCAAISDYKANKQIQGKLASGKKLLKLELVPTTKIIKIIRKRCPKSYLVGFKAESNETEKRIINKAHERLTEWKLNMIIANDLMKVTNKTNQIIIINPDKSYIKVKGDKELLAEHIFNEILKQL